MSQIKNPYSEMLSLMASQGAKVNTPGISFGIIKSVEPLLVETGGIVLDSNFVSLAGRLKPYTANCELSGQFDINTLWTPTISEYDMPNKIIGLTATSTPSVTGGDGTVNVTVNTTINNDSHTHGLHSHTSTSLTKISGQGTFIGTINMKDYGVKAGDKVILLCTDDRQQYFVVDKV